MPTTRSKARRARADIVTRWAILLAMTDDLMGDIQAAPSGAFTPDEQQAASLSIEQVWSLLAIRRPPYGADGRPKNRRHPMLRAEFTCRVRAVHFEPIVAAIRRKQSEVV